MDQNYLIRTRINTSVYGMSILDYVISKCFDDNNASFKTVVTVEELSKNFSESARHTIDTVNNLFSKNELTCSFEENGMETSLSIFTAYHFDRKTLSVTANTLLKKFYKKLPSCKGIDFSTKYSYILYNTLISAMEDKDDLVLDIPLITIKGIMNILPDDNTSYCRFNNFKDKILEPAIEEIKQKTNLFVTATYKKEGVQVTEVRFICKKIEELEIPTDVSRSPLERRLLAYYSALNYSHILKNCMPEFNEKTISTFLAEAGNDTNKVLDAYIELKKTDCKDPRSFMIERLRE